MPLTPYALVVHAWVGQIITFFAYSPPSLPLGSLTPTQPGRGTDPTRGCPGAWVTLGSPSGLRQSAGYSGVSPPA